MTYSVVLVTAPSKEEAEMLARAVLERKLAACVNLIPGVLSLFWWEGKIEESQEVLMVLKTTGAAVPALVEEIKTLHSYSVSEVISLPVDQGNPAYLQWIGDTVHPQL